MANKIIRVEKCTNCPYLQNLDNGMVCQKYPIWKNIYANEVIPEWCPLADEKDEFKQILSEQPETTRRK